jgi:hypothetical protein
MGDSALYFNEPFCCLRAPFFSEKHTADKKRSQAAFLLDFTQFVQVASLLFPRMECLVPVAIFLGSLLHFSGATNLSTRVLV